MKQFLMAAVIVSILMVLMSGQVVSAGPQDAPTLSGKVVETMDSGGYTYACIEKSGKKTWVAVPQTKIKKGQTLTFQPGMEMTNFESKTLKRKFDRIVFSGGLVK